MSSKTAYTFTVLYMGIGAGIFSLSSIFRHELSDFTLGFCEGVAGTLILASAIFLIWYLAKTKRK